jgi:glycerophosphoryl diester phosphodiesterase
VACLADRSCRVPLACAHRGKCGVEPENTLAAYAACVAAGVPMIELDTRETADRAIVVMHDGETTRTTDGETRFPDRVAVSELTLAEFRSLVVDDARCRPDPESAPERCHPPTFEQALARTAPRTVVMVDFKAGDAARVAAAVAAAGAAGRVLFFDGDLAHLRAYRAALPGGLVMPRAEALADYDRFLDPAAADLGLAWIHGDPPHAADVGTRLLARGLRLYVNGFVDVDPSLILAQLSSGAERERYERTAWANLERLVGQGAYGFGTDFAALYAAHLYPDGWAE